MEIREKKTVRTHFITCDFPLFRINIVVRQYGLSRKDYIEENPIFITSLMNVLRYVK